MTMDAIVEDVPASTVDTSTYPFPGASPSAAALATSRAASGVLTMTKTTSASRAASAALAASVPPASTTGAAAAAVRFHTHTSCPALSRFFAMGTPMMPQPRNASFIGSGVFSLSDAVAARGSGAGTGVSGSQSRPTRGSRSTWRYWRRPPSVASRNETIPTFAMRRCSSPESSARRFWK